MSVQACTLCSLFHCAHFQGAQCRLLHAGGQETEAQGWCFGKMFCVVQLFLQSHTQVTHTQTHLHLHAQAHARGKERQMVRYTEREQENDLRTHNVNIYSLDCNYVCTCTDVCAIARVCVRAQWLSVEWKSISYQGLYCIVCVIYCTICLQGNVAFKDWWCLQDYTISKELSDPPRTMKWDLFNLLFILCLRIVSSDLSRDLHLSRRLFKEKTVRLLHCC